MAKNEHFEIILESVAKQYDYDITPKQYIGEMNSVAILANQQTADRAVLKVPNETQPGIECSVLDFIGESTRENPAPFQLPSVIHYNDAPPYLLLNYVPGVVLEQDAYLSLPEIDRQNLGNDLAKFVIWEALSL